ncbi:hypothetical protein GVAV_003149 [Gurleya vavrai]
MDHKDVFMFDNTKNISEMNSAAQKIDSLANNSSENTSNQVLNFLNNKNDQNFDISDAKNIFISKKRLNLYKTEMCRSFEEAGHCKYGDRCQFAHDEIELRGITRHPRYKTEICKTFFDSGTCPYGKRCCFIHTANKFEVSNINNENNFELNKFEEIKICNKDKQFLKNIEKKINNDLLEQNFTSQEIKYSNNIKFRNENVLINEKIISDKSRNNKFINFSKNINIATSFTKNFERCNFNKIANEEDEMFLSKIPVSEQAKSKIGCKPIFDQQNFNYFEKLDAKEKLLEFKPFWLTNSASIWVSPKNSFCYVKKLSRHCRKKMQPNAVGDYFWPSYEEEIADFVMNHLEL